MSMLRWISDCAIAATIAAAWVGGDAAAQVAVKAAQLYPMTGDLQPLENAVVLCAADGTVEAVGAADAVAVPDGYRVIEAAVVMPGIVDAHATVGLSGILNSEKHDQEQLELSSPIQPELRAIDAYNGRDPLVAWVRGLGITTVNTGHAPGALISGQLMAVKTDATAIASAEDTLDPLTMIAATLGADALFADGDKAPGTRAKAVAMLRAEFLKAQTYLEKKERAAGEGDDGDPPDPDLRMESLAMVLKNEVPLLVTAQRHHDIAAALRLRAEFGFDLILDGAAEAYLLLDEIKAAGIPVIVHPTMARPYGDRENMTFSLAAKLHEAGIPFAFQSGYESYVPKTRVALFEAAMATAYGLPREHAMAACTIRAAEIVGVSERVGSIEVGKDADLALFDGDPLETASRCVAVIINGAVVSDEPR